MSAQAQAQTGANVVVFQPPRLPFHPAIEERFGVDKTQWKALVEAVFPNAETIDSVAMALAYCKARNLDVFKRPVHIVPVYSSALRRMVETVWPGISELRTTAMRTGAYAGKDKTEFGPDRTEDLGGVKVTFPEWAQVTVYRMVSGVRCAFEGPEVHWLEYYAKAKKDSPAPNAMWQGKPRSQLQKCAEAGALRAAFPEEIGNEYCAEEVEGQAFGGPLRNVTPTATNAGLSERLRAAREAAAATEGFNVAHGGPADAVDAEYEEADQGDAGKPADPLPGSIPAEGGGTSTQTADNGGSSAENSAGRQDPPRQSLKQRLESLKALIDEAETVADLTALKDKNAKLWADVDAGDPDEVGTVQELDAYCGDRMAQIVAAAS